MTNEYGHGNCARARASFFQAPIIASNTGVLRSGGVNHHKPENSTVRKVGTKKTANRRCSGRLGDVQ